MRVLMTADAVGGVWTYTADLAAALRAVGVEVHVATMGRAPDATQRGQVEHLHVSTFRLEWEDDPWDDVERAGAWLLELADELQPDVVHLNGYAHADGAWRAPVVVVAHSDVVSWWWAVHRCAPPPRYDEYVTRVTAGLRAADAVVAPTHAVRDDLRRHYGARERQVVVPNGRDARPLGNGAKDGIVAGLGRFWDAAKNVAALERARGASPWPVVVAGPGTAAGRLDPAAAAALLGRAAVFASPARYEPFGLTVLEAAHAGCALVLGDIASLRELWSGAALFVPPDDDAALATALSRLAGDDALRDELAAAARARAAGYTVERMRDAYLAVYAGVRSKVTA
jgi:glycogen synthase